MKICIFGCGYLGLTIACGLSVFNHDIYCIDKNDYRVKNLKLGIIDIYEPEIQEKLEENNKIRFYDTDNIEDGTDIFIIAVGTLEKESGEIDCGNIKQAISTIISSISKYSVIVIKSTVPIGFCEQMYNEFKQKATSDFDIIYNPEFLSQGSAVSDFLNPHKILIGSTSQIASQILKKLYKPFKAPIIETDLTTAELSKLACDSFLATKISFINEISNLASKTKSDISKIQQAMMLDKRIGSDFLSPCAGFGGNSLPKSLNLLIKKGEELKVGLNAAKASRISNEQQKRQFISNILKYYNYNIEAKVFCIWGLSFKKNTSDMRYSPSMMVADTLSRYGATIRAYDPKAINNSIRQYKTKEDAVLSSNALIILGDWDEFKNPDFRFISDNLKDKVIFDGRNLYLNDNLEEYGLRYYYIGNQND